MKKNKALQYFSDEYLTECRKLTSEQILLFLDNFRQLHGNIVKEKKSKLISMKVPEDLLQNFKTKSLLHKTPYQTMIKNLMKQWLNS